MSDLLIYRAVEPVGGTIVAFVNDDGHRAAVINTDRDVDSILLAEVNRVPSPMVSLLGTRKLLVRIPDEVSEISADRIIISALSEVEIDRLQGGPVPSTLGLGSRPKIVSGMAQAIQTAQRTLLMRPGTDTWHPERGGGLRDLRNVLVDPSDISRLTRVAQVAVNRYNSTVGRLRTSARSRRSGPIRTPSWQVVKVELQAVRALSRSQAEKLFGLRTASVLGENISASAFDPNATVIAVSLAHEVRGPSATFVNVSSAVAV